jgi:DNA-binding transcriptional regulator PaaX
MKRTTKRKLKKAAKAITNEILWTLRDLGELVPYPFEGKYQHLQRLRNYDRYKVSRALRDLSTQGLVKKVSRERKIYYGLTDLGRAKSLRYAYLKKHKRAKTNGLSTIIIFDIPEEKRKARRFLRKFLKDNGFINLQKSVLIGPWEIHPEFKDLLRELKVELNVSVIEGRVLYN